MCSVCEWSTTGITYSNNIILFSRIYQCYDNTHKLFSIQTRRHMLKWEVRQRRYQGGRVDCKKQQRLWNISEEDQSVGRMVRVSQTGRPKKRCKVVVREEMQLLAKLQVSEHSKRSRQMIWWQAPKAELNENKYWIYIHQLDTKMTPNCWLFEFVLLASKL